MFDVELLKQHFNPGGLFKTIKTLRAWSDPECTYTDVTVKSGSIIMLTKVDHRIGSMQEYPYVTTRRFHLQFVYGEKVVYIKNLSGDRMVNEIERLEPCIIQTTTSNN